MDRINGSLLDPSLTLSPTRSPEELEEGCTVRAALSCCEAAFAAAGVPNAGVEAEWLLAGVLGKSKAELQLESTRRLSSTEGKAISTSLARRVSGEPLQYVLGKEGFRYLELEVEPDVFIPRPETELLVDAGLALIRDLEEPVVVDLCTGSGTIALSIAREVERANVHGVDISERAIAIARRNATRNRVRAQFVVGDLFQGIEFLKGNVDLVISNPPYIPTGEIPGLSPEVKREPAIALDGGPDGLDFHRRIIAQAPEYLHPGGGLVLEIGDGQAERLIDLLEKGGAFAAARVHLDYGSMPRIVAARRAEV